MIEDARVEVRNQVADGFGAGRAFSGQDRIISTVLPDLDLLAGRLCGLIVYSIDRDDGLFKSSKAPDVADSNVLQLGL